MERVRGENRKVRKLKGKMKMLRQYIAKMANEIHQRKIWRKATNKEKRYWKISKEEQTVISPL